MIQIKDGECFGGVCTSSGGPWLKEPGRIGSSSVRSAGFDVKQWRRADSVDSDE